MSNETKSFEKMLQTMGNGALYTLRGQIADYRDDATTQPDRAIAARYIRIINEELDYRAQVAANRTRRAAQAQRK